MRFECPACKKQGFIDDSKVPNEGIYANCPDCETKFKISRQTDFSFEPACSDKTQEKQSNLNGVKSKDQPKEKSKSSLGMKWYFFWLYISLPLGALFEFIYMFSGGLILLIGAVSVIIHLLTIYGLHKKTYWGWKLNFVIIGLTYGVGSIPSQIPGQHLSQSALLYQFIIKLLLFLILWCWPNYVYWTKRKTVFTNKNSALFIANIPETILMLIGALLVIITYSVIFFNGVNNNFEFSSTNMTTTDKQQVQKESPKDVVESKQAPEFRVISFDGSEVTLSSLRGNVVLVRFWATWAPTCHEEIPSLIKLERLMVNKPFQIISISVDEGGKATIEDFFNKNGTYFRAYFDPTASTAKLYGITGVPESFLIDKRGVVVKKVVGGLDWTSPEVVNYLNQMISKL